MIVVLLCVLLEKSVTHFIHPQQVEGCGKSPVSSSFVHSVKIEFFPQNYTLVQTDAPVEIDPMEFLPIESDATGVHSDPENAGLTLEMDEMEGGGATL